MNASPAVLPRPGRTICTRRFPTVIVHDFLERIFAAAEHAGRVGQQKWHGAPVRGLLDDIARRARRRIHDRAASARNTVKKCRFPDIRATDQNDCGELF